jgi:anti-anti-sigma factor
MSPLTGSTGDIICDLTDVTFIDSTGIRLFVQMHRSRDAGSAVVLRNAPPNVERVFALTGLSDLGIRVERT